MDGSGADVILRAPDCLASRAVGRRRIGFSQKEHDHESQRVVEHRDCGAGIRNTAVFAQAAKEIVIGALCPLTGQRPQAASMLSTR